MTNIPDSLLPSQVSDIDRRRWQRAAARALTEILKRADAKKLKPIDWTIGSSLFLIGNLNATDYGNVDRAVIEAFVDWVGLLGLTSDPQVTKSGGGLYLVGRHENWRPQPNLTGAHVTVIAQTFTL